MTEPNDKLIGDIRILIHVNNQPSHLGIWDSSNMHLAVRHRTTLNSIEFSFQTTCHLKRSSTNTINTFMQTYDPAN